MHEQFIKCDIVESSFVGPVLCVEIKIYLVKKTTL